MTIVLSGLPHLELRVSKDAIVSRKFGTGAGLLCLAISDPDSRACISVAVTVQRNPLRHR